MGRFLVTLYRVNSFTIFLLDTRSEMSYNSTNRVALQPAVRASVVCSRPSVSDRLRVGGCRSIGKLRRLSGFGLPVYGGECRWPLRQADRVLYRLFLWSIISR